MKHIEKSKSYRPSRLIMPITGFKVVNTYNYPLNISLFAPSRNGVESMYIIPNENGVTYKQIQSDLLINSWMVSRVKISVCDYPAPVFGGENVKSKLGDEITIANRYGKALSLIRFDYEHISGSKMSNPIITKPFFARRVNKQILDVDCSMRISKDSSLTITIPPFTSFDISLFCNLTDYLKVKDKGVVNHLNKDTIKYIQRCEEELIKINSYYNGIFGHDDHPARLRGDADGKLQSMFLNIYRILLKSKEKSDVIRIYNLTQEILSGSVELLKDFRSKEYAAELKKWKSNRRLTGKTVRIDDSMKERYSRRVLARKIRREAKGNYRAIRTNGKH